jgi:hypothetical protein
MGNMNQNMGGGGNQPNQMKQNSFQGQFHNKPSGNFQGNKGGFGQNTGYKGQNPNQHQHQNQNQNQGGHQSNYDNQQGQFHNNQYQKNNNLGGGGNYTKNDGADELQHLFCRDYHFGQQCKFG